MRVVGAICILVLLHSCNKSQSGQEDMIVIESTSQPIAEFPSLDDTANQFFDSTVYTFLIETGMVYAENVVAEEIMAESAKGIYFASEEQEHECEDQDKISAESFSLYRSEGEDSLYMRQQIERVKDKKWDLKKLGAYATSQRYKNWEKWNPEFDWEKFKSEGFACFVSLGVPIFNKDHTVAIVYQSSVCQALLGYGVVLKFERVSGKWEVTDQMQLWMS